MRQVSLGSRDREIGVGAIGQGTAMEFCANAGSLRQAVRLLHRGAELGMTLVDTAPSYEFGLAEAVVGRALQENRSRFVVATKFPPECSAPDDLVRSVEGSIRRLRTTAIDLLQIHWPHPKIPFDETLGAMTRLVERGLVRALGLGNCTVDQVLQALASEAAPHLASVQQEFSLAQRSAAEGLLPLCREHGLTLLAYSPLGRGRVLVRGSGSVLLAQMARRLGTNPAATALAWLASDPDVIPIPRAASEGHLEQNAGSGDLILADDDRLALARAFEPRIEEIETGEIRVGDDDPAHPTYTTLDEARANRLGLVPGPAELAERIAAGELLKPVRVAALHDPGADGGRYRLLEGRIRYWAWVIAFDGQRAIPAIVEESGLEKAA